MSHNPPTISRRTVAKGTLWVAPTLAAAAAAPAFAASPDIDCTKVPPGMVRKTTSVRPSVAGVVMNNRYPGGSRWGLVLGSWMLPDIQTLDGQKVTGFYIKPGFCGSDDCTYKVPSPEFNTIWTQDGQRHVGRVAVAAPVGCSPIVANEGLDAHWSIDTDIPYSADVCEVIRHRPEMILKRISIPVTIIPLVILTSGQYRPVGACCVYFNMEFDDADGCYSTRPAASWSWANGPLHP